MAREFIDGFEAGDVKLWTIVSNTPIVATGISGMDGTYCANLLNGEIKRDITAAGEYYFACRWRPTNLGVRNIISVYKDTTILVRVEVNYGVIKVYRGATLIATGTATIVVNTTYRIEVRVKIDDAVGVVQVKVNGILDIDFSGDTKPGADTQMNNFIIGFPTTSSYGAYYDNVIVDTNSWPGDTKIQAIVPTGVGTSTQWAPSSGANWQCVDEKPASEADLNSSNTVGHLDTYAAGDLVGSIENVKCLQVQALAVKEGAPTPLNLQLAVKSGATTYLSTDKAVPATTSKGLAALWELDPATAAAWEIDAVNAAEIGMKAVA